MAHCSNRPSEVKQYPGQESQLNYCFGISCPFSSSDSLQPLHCPKSCQNEEQLSGSCTSHHLLLLLSSPPTQPCPAAQGCQNSSPPKPPLVQCTFRQQYTAASAAAALLIPHLNLSSSSSSPSRVMSVTLSSSEVTIFTFTSSCLQISTPQQ